MGANISSLVVSSVRGEAPAPDLDLIANCCCNLGNIVFTNKENKKNKVINVHMYCVKKDTVSNCGILV